MKMIQSLRLLPAVLLVSSCGESGFLWGDPLAGKVSEGNALYARGETNEALIRYRDAEIDAPKDTRIQFNMGNVFYRQGKFEEAEAAFVAATLSGDDISKADAHYNIGNSHFKLNRYDKAVESYQRALELNPGDRDAKFNLELVQKLLNRAAENAQSGPSQQRKPSSWARDRMREAESLAQQGKYGAAHQIIARTFQTEPTAAGEFGDFAGRVSDLRAVFGDGR